MKIITNLRPFNKLKNKSKHRLYKTWVLMMHRCLNDKHEAFKDYGGRGITVCESWKDFAVFINDVGPRPSRLHTLDRIDNSRGYSKENCRWATMHEQCNNRRSNVKIIYEGVEYNVLELCRKFQLHPRSLYDVRKRGEEEVIKYINSRRRCDFNLYKVGDDLMTAEEASNKFGIQRQIFLKRYRKYGNNLVELSKINKIKTYKVNGEELTALEISKKYNISTDSIYRAMKNKNKKNKIFKLLSS